MCGMMRTPALTAADIGLGNDAGAAWTVDDRLIGLTAADSAEFEQYLVLRQAVERAREASGFSVVGVTSATVGDGKTTTAINLAAALARTAEARVLIIDADMRVPAVGARLGVTDDGRVGLAELLADAALPAADVVRRRPACNLSVLTAGRLDGANPYELLHSARFGALVAHARAAYDYIVIDTPPVVPVPDCRLIEASVDGFLVVVAAHRTPRRLLAEALTILGPEKAMGLVFNRADRPFRGYYGAPYGYGAYARGRRAAR
jgi:tyrosine-protein kinase